MKIVYFRWNTKQLGRLWHWRWIRIPRTGRTFYEKFNWWINSTIRIFSSKRRRQLFDGQPVFFWHQPYFPIKESSWQSSTFLSWKAKSRRYRRLTELVALPCQTPPTRVTSLAGCCPLKWLFCFISRIGSVFRLPLLVFGVRRSATSTWPVLLLSILQVSRGLCSRRMPSRTYWGIKIDQKLKKHQSIKWIFN
jgi:hypothetical protein